MKQKIENKKDFPKCVRNFTHLKGICIGGCVDKGFREGAIAHAHSHPTSNYHGWICLRYKYQLKNKLLLLHEVAHLIMKGTEKFPHGKKWKKTVVEIGGTFKSFQHNRSKETLDYTYRHI